MVWNALDHRDICKVNEEYEKLRSDVAKAIWTARHPPYPYECVSGDELIDLLEEVDTALHTVYIALREANDAMIHHGASAADYPSVFMGGPSHNGRDKAQRIWKAMFDSTPLGHLNDR